AACRAGAAVGKPAPFAGVSRLSGIASGHPILPAINVNWLTHARACVLFSQPGRPHPRHGGDSGDLVSQTREKPNARSQSRSTRAKANRIRKPPADLAQQLESCRRELAEVREQQTATSEVLRVISNSPIDLQSALGAIAESAARLLDVAGAEINRLEGDGLRLIAKHGAFSQRP